MNPTDAFASLSGQWDSSGHPLEGLMRLLGFPPFSERDVEAKMIRFEDARRSGTFIHPREMDAAGREAIRRLLHGATPGPQFDAPYNVPPPRPDPRFTPEQGGVWMDAEKEQQERVLKGLPMIR